MINKALLASEAAKYGISLDSTALDKFDTYAQLLVQTNRQYNLTSITEPDEIVYKHFVDSLVLSVSADIDPGARVIDVGTGAGFPGIPLLILRPDIRLTLLDSTAKKLVFIETVLAELGLAAETLHSRAELAARSPEYREKFDVAAARAVAALPVLSEYCLPFLKLGGRFIAMKSRGADEEISSAEGAIGILGGKIAEVKRFEIENCGSRTLIITKKISQTPPKYPRASAQISKKPLA